MRFYIIPELHYLGKHRAYRIKPPIEYQHPPECGEMNESPAASYRFFCCDRLISVMRLNDEYHSSICFPKNNHFAGGGLAP